MFPAQRGTLTPTTVAKANYALSALDTLDFVYIHVESPDESGHEGNLDHKMQAIEDIDKKLLAVHCGKAWRGRDHYRLADCAGP